MTITGVDEEYKMIKNIKWLVVIIAGLPILGIAFLSKYKMPALVILYTIALTGIVFYCFSVTDKDKKCIQNKIGGVVRIGDICE